MITLLGLISFYLGVHWGFEQDVLRGSGIDATMVDEAYWIFNLAQVFIITLLHIARFGVTPVIFIYGSKQSFNACSNAFLGCGWWHVFTVSSGLFRAFGIS